LKIECIPNRKSAHRTIEHNWNIIFIYRSNQSHSIARRAGYLSIVRQTNFFVHAQW